MTGLPYVRVVAVRAEALAEITTIHGILPTMGRSGDGPIRVRANPCRALSRIGLSSAGAVGWMSLWLLHRDSELASL